MLSWQTSKAQIVQHSMQQKVVFLLHSSLLSAERFFLPTILDGWVCKATLLFFATMGMKQILKEKKNKFSARQWVEIDSEGEKKTSFRCLDQFKTILDRFEHVFKHVWTSGHALGIWICGCTLFYKRELWTSKSVGVHIELKASKSAGLCIRKKRIPKTLAK